MALHVRAVGGAQVAGDNAVVGDVDFQVLAGDARIVNDDIATGTAADYRLVFGEQVLVAVHLEHWAVLGLRIGGDRHGIALHGFGGEVEVALGQVEILLEDHDHRAYEGVMLALRVLGEIVGQLIGQGLATPCLDTVEVRSTELETVFIRGHRAVTAHGHGLGVNLALQGAGKIDRLQVFGAKLGEYSVDCTLHAFFKTVENAHSPPFLILTHPTR